MIYGCILDKNVLFYASSSSWFSKSQNPWTDVTKVLPKCKEVTPGEREKSQHGKFSGKKWYVFQNILNEGTREISGSVAEDIHPTWTMRHCLPSSFELMLLYLPTNISFVILVSETKICALFFYLKLCSILY